MSADLSEPQKKRIKDSTEIQPNTPESSFSDSVDDGSGSDLEVKLATITGEVKKPANTETKQTSKKLIPPSELEKMVADCMKDVDSDEEAAMDEMSLEKELQEITGFTPVEEKQEISFQNGHKEALLLPTTSISTIEIIKKRITMYELAEQDAETDGETTRARRFNRGLKTLHDLLQKAESGETINVGDIPPEVIMKKAHVTALNAKKQEYEVAIKAAKLAGDVNMENQYKMIINQFDRVIQDIEDGKDVDLSDMPPSPSGLKAFLDKMQSSASK